METSFKFSYPSEFSNALDETISNYLTGFTGDFLPSLRYPDVSAIASKLENLLEHPAHSVSSRYHLWTTITRIRLSENCKNATSGYYKLTDDVKSLFAKEIPEDPQLSIEYLFRCSYVMAYLNQFETPYGTFHIHPDEFLNVIQPWFVKNAKALDAIHRNHLPQRDEAMQKDFSKLDGGLPFPWWGMYGVFFILGILLDIDDAFGDAAEPLAQTMAEVLSEGVEYYGWQLFFYACSGLDIWQQRTGKTLSVIPSFKGQSVKVHLDAPLAIARGWKASRTQGLPITAANPSAVPTAKPCKNCQRQNPNP